MQRIIEQSVSQNRFSSNQLYEQLIQYFEINNLFCDERRILTNSFGQGTYKYILQGLIRNCFLIELVNNDISTTIMEVRWAEKDAAGKKQEPFNPTDPRFASYNICFRIFNHLLSTLTDNLDEDKIKLINNYHALRLIPYELPIDYSPTEPRHNLGSLNWFWDEHYKTTILLRKYLMDTETNNQASLFRSILSDKIKVKTYLTDRVQTGAHKTNREKRWEVHPDSVHYANRRNCLEIEYALTSQLCHFENFPEDIFRNLIDNRIIQDNHAIFRCPITLDFMSFTKLVNEINNRTHGKSYFQVGHLNPLKNDGDNQTSGHVAANVIWISSEGNRIQGDLSLNEARALITRISGNYSRYFEYFR